MNKEKEEEEDEEKEGERGPAWKACPGVSLGWEKNNHIFKLRSLFWGTKLAEWFLIVE